MKFRHLLIFAILLSFTSCNKYDAENWQTLKKLHKTYKNGSISECTYNGETVYQGQSNAYDASSQIYDKDGNQIGNCNYAWGGVDDICFQLEGCEMIYVIEDNIWGYPEVNKYGL